MSSTDAAAARASTATSSSSAARPALMVATGRVRSASRARYPEAVALEARLNGACSGSNGSAARRASVSPRMTDRLADRLREGPVLCAEGYLFELERRGYL